MKKDKKIIVFILSTIIINFFGIVIIFFGYDNMAILFQIYLSIQCYFAYRSYKLNPGNKNVEKVIIGMTICFLIIIPFQLLNIYYLFTSGNEMPEKYQIISLALILLFILVYASYMVITDERNNYKFYIKITINKILHFANSIKNKRK